VSPSAKTPAAAEPSIGSLSLYHLLDPGVQANPYPLYRRLRTEDPVHWDPYLHVWLVSRYEDVQLVLQRFLAARSPTPEQLTSVGLGELTPIAHVLVRQMLFMDPPAHARLRGLAAAAFTPARVEKIRQHIQDITDSLIDAVLSKGRMDVMADFADLLPATVTTELMGLPVSDRDQLKKWSKDFSEMLGNFQHNPGRVAPMLKTVEDLIAYFRDKVREQERNPRDGVVQAFVNAEVDGDRLSEAEVIANCIITMVGGLETTTNLIGNGLMLLLKHRSELTRLRENPSLMPSAVEELLRFESPIQHTGRLAPEDVELGDKRIGKRQAVLALLGAANRDPDRFPNPDSFDITRTDNRHLAFGWASHYCFGAPLARMEGLIAFSTILRRLPNLALDPVPLVWRFNQGFRGLEALPVSFGSHGGCA
jgi:cytochrome P450